MYLISFNEIYLIHIFLYSKNTHLPKPLHPPEQFLGDLNQSVGP